MPWHQKPTISFVELGQNLCVYFFLQGPNNLVADLHAEGLWLFHSPCGAQLAQWGCDSLFGDFYCHTNPMLR